MDKQILDTHHVEDKALVAYAFMAALNNREFDLFENVYMPLFKKAMSDYASSKQGGKDTDIKDKLFDLYGLDVPIYTVRLMLTQLWREMSRREKKETEFNLFENGKSFTIGAYTFTDLDRQYGEEVRNINALHLAFGEYLRGTEHAAETTPTFAAFIDKNKKYLSNFFGKDRVERVTLSGALAAYKSHAEFLLTIGTHNQSLFEVAQKLYLGSVLAAVLETGVETKSKFAANRVYYLDTQFILRALDLQNEEETLPAIELVDLIVKSGGKTAVLDITMNEVSENLSRAITHFNSNPLLLSVKNPSIDYACKRRGLSKTELQHINDSIERTVAEKLHASINVVPNSTKEKAGKSEDHKKLQATRYKSGNALHDVTAYMYVRDRRGAPIKAYQKAEYWFLTSNVNLYNFNRSQIDQGVIPEIITPDELASLIWLKNPNAFGRNVAKIGLNELIAQTVVSNIPTFETLIELDRNLKKHIKVTPEQYAAMASNLATASVEKIQKLNDMAVQEAQKFSQEVLAIAEEEKNRRIQLEELAKTQAVTGNRLKEVEALLNEARMNNKNKGVESNTLAREKIQLIRIIKSLAVLVGALILFIISPYLSDISDYVVKLFQLIASGAGLWGFINMIMNILKLKKKT